MSHKILIISHSPIQAQMAGPAIRCWELAKVLAESLAATSTVTLASPQAVIPALQTQTPAKLAAYTAEILPALALAHDVLIFQGFVLEQYPELRTLDKILIADLYDPFPLESLENPQETDDSGRWQRHLQNMSALNRQILHADYFLCASEKQKDYWLGMLTALHRVNPATYRAGNFEHLIGVVPFGLPETLFPARGELPREKLVPYGIQDTDFVLMWGGGLWDWLDPLTPIRAVAELAQRGQPVKLFFMGTTTPDPNSPAMCMGERAVKLAQDLGIKETHVIFNTEWVPYAERHLFLREADVGLSGHFDHLETRFSFRTRALDYLWAGLPIITTEGDTIADWVKQSGAGQVAGFTSVGDWIEAIQKLRNPEQYQAAQAGVESLRPQLTWKTAARPLIEFCQNPRRSPDASYQSSFQMALVLGVFPWLQKGYQAWRIYDLHDLGQKLWQRAKQWNRG